LLRFTPISAEFRRGKKGEEENGLLPTSHKEGEGEKGEMELFNCGASKKN